jgi:hypothetical protein
MSHNESRKGHRTLKRQAEIRKLRSLECDAIKHGRKLGSRDRLKAAFHLTRAWHKAKGTGLRKENFQEEILRRLQRPHSSRQEFRLSNWTLRRGEDPMTQQGLGKKYETSPTPQKALEPYLVAIAVAAEHCGVDPDDWKLIMAQDLSIWLRPSGTTDIQMPDDRPWETLAVLLNSLCARLAKENRLGQTFAVIREMNCRWDMFGEQLTATGSACMQLFEIPSNPVLGDDVYFEEMFPFPSIPLLRVPYGTGTVIFDLAPADDVRGLVQLAGDFTWYREIRLCIVPDGSERFVSALESRPRMEVQFPLETPFEGQHHVLYGHEIELERGLFYGRSEDGGDLFPTIRTQDGRAWTIKKSTRAGAGPQAHECIVRDPDTTGWSFDHDPVGHPGQVYSEPWYLSYTAATPLYLRHWLAQEWQLGNTTAVNPWSRDNFESGSHGDRWNRNLPPIHELNFPRFNHATSIECCLHNGLIEEALQASIEHLTEQTKRLQADWHGARERHSDALLLRWNTETSEDTPRSAGP